MPTTAGQEAIRKSVHVVASAGAAAAVWWLPPLHAAIVLAAASTVALTVELARRLSGAFGAVFHRYLGPLLRDRETRRLTGATTLALGYTLAATLFPGVPTLLAIAVAGVADAVAAVVGKRFGRLRYPGGKSLEGSVAFVLVVLPFALMVPGLPVGAAVALALIIGILEAPTLPIADNLYLPAATAAAVESAALLTGVTFFS